MRQLLVIHMLCVCKLLQPAQLVELCLDLSLPMSSTEDNDDKVCMYVHMHSYNNNYNIAAKYNTKSP